VSSLGVAPETPEETDWLEAEANQGTLRTELKRLKRRAKERKLLVVFLAFLGAAAVVHKLSKRVPMYTASVVMRATEGVLVDEESPIATQGLANYLYSVALSKERLMPLIEKHNLYPARETFGNLFAIDELRNFLDIEIGSNFFAGERDEGDPQRSVGITVHFTDFDPNLAFNVAQDLGKVLMAAEVERRKNHAKKLSAIAKSTVGYVQERLLKQTDQLAQADLTIDSGNGDPKAALAVAEARIKKKRLLEDIKQTTLVLEAVSADQSYTDLAQAAEGANQALQFEIVDVRRPLIIPPTSKVVYGIVGLFIFICLLPLCAIGLAAMDTKLHHIEDVMRLGMPVVGHVPGFPGSQVGTLRERSRRAKHTS
tara:strand:- start:45042 stop:46148 length:1107 start_codon:yes stop_codon:yes gene_type:complete